MSSCGEGIPYMGSKRGIAREIVTFIRSQNPNAKYFYDIFGGGGSISFEALRQGYEKVYYVDLDEGMCNMMQQIKNGIPKERYNRVSREEFHELKTKTDAYSVCMSLCFSFGNKRATYAYSEELEPRKKALHYAVVFEDYKYLEEIGITWKLEGKTLEERRLDIRNKTDMGIMKKLAQEYSDSGIYSLQTMQALENIQRLQNIERLENIEIINSTYKKIKIQTPLEETVVYLDPPYRGTGTYAVQNSVFDYKALDKRFRELPCIAYMSEENPHKVALTMEKQRTMQMKNRSKVYEVLYTNGKTLEEKQEQKQPTLFDI